ncbi:DUF3048 domain-containing protein [Streptomyces sp. NPDC090029]|uniref:DUF3048 domain-containing protein n=1 Tax=Streptomyces sp. NPDC090029 TaxID=3365924 RepID=UPI00380C29C4
MEARSRTRPRRHARAAAACAAGLLLAGLIGCTGTAPDPGASSASQGTSHFTGLAAPNGPVLAVKIDNVRPARPHTGLDAADLVYVEQVEAGLTRLLAVYSSRLPPSIGPVRSARESDLELLRQFGRPALAYSGARSALLPVIEAAPIAAVTPATAPGAYVRADDRPAPHNLYLRPRQALDAAERVDDARDIGLRFGPPTGTGRSSPEHTVRYPAARYTFTWSPERGGWQIAMDGTAAATADGTVLAPATVVVQYTDIRPSRFADRSGSTTPYTETVGSGRALVLRDGRAFDARWERPTAEAGTRFTTPSGEPADFARGQVWILLAPR